MLSENQLSGFDIAEVRENEGNYNYYGFTRFDGSWKILREKTDGTEYRFAVGGKDFSTYFVNRATLVYKTSNNLPRA